MLFKRKQITANTWMILDDTKPFGFLRKVDEPFKEVYYQLLVQNESFIFATYKEIEDQFGKIVDIEPPKKDHVDVKGFPARHKGAIAVDHPSLPVYSVGGNVRFVAGYFALRFNNAKGYQVVHGPKLSTVEGNEIIGPFKTRLEALGEVNIYNRRLENEKNTQQ